MYLSCPTCHLRVFRRPDEVTAERCPRCGASASVSLQRERMQRRVGAAVDGFAFDVVRHGTTTTLRVTGEVDVSNQEQLHAAGATAARRCECLVVDMTGTTFLSSSGVRALLEVRKVIQADGGRMITLVRSDGAAARVIELCSLTEHLGVVHEPSAVTA
jgi:anti-anti-sigma factor